jgi:hypothetical protein
VHFRIPEEVWRFVGVLLCEAMEIGDRFVSQLLLVVQGASQNQGYDFRHNRSFLIFHTLSGFFETWYKKILD